MADLTADSQPGKWRLYTFGTLRLTGESAQTVLGDHGHQRRRLALLAVLAAAGERGRSRDQLLGIFWPEVSQSKARHSLEQLLYAIRTSLDANIFTGTSPVRLNPASITSDIGEFTDALAQKHDEAAVSLYGGPFIDGFYLNGAPEFEQWADLERARIERSYIDALEQLVSRDERRNDFASAAEWHRKLSETDPLSSKHATGLIHALMNAGDHSAALKHAQRYESLVAHELGTSAGPAIAALVKEVRERAVREPVAVRRHAVEPVPESRDDDSSEFALSDSPVGESPVGEFTGSAAAALSSVHGSRVSRTRKLLRSYAAPLLGIAALMMLAVWPRLRPDRRSAALPNDESSIAVLPLVNVSGDPHDGALADGLTEELTAILGRVARLRVVARTSSFAFKNTSVSVPEIASRLGVSNLLEGAFQKIGGRIHVQVRMVDGRDGSTRWSETYDRELNDVFAVQAEIARSVAQELKLKFAASGGNSRNGKPTQSIAAYELYLRGKDPALLRSDSAALGALEIFKRAVALDSTYAAAHAGVARMYLRLRGSDLLGLPPRASFLLARKAAEKAVALDGSLAESHAAVGLVRMVGYDFPGAEKELQRAVEIDPTDSRLREWLAFLYDWKGQRAEALNQSRRAVLNDPLSPSAHAELARALCLNGRFDQGLSELRSLEALQPPLARAALYTGFCYGMANNWSDAEGALRKATGATGRAALGHALAREGHRKEAEEILSELRDQWSSKKGGAFLVAVIYAGLDDNDDATEWLNRSIDDQSFSPQMTMALFDSLRGDARFDLFLGRLGIQTR